MIRKEYAAEYKTARNKEQNIRRNAKWQGLFARYHNDTWYIYHNNENIFSTRDWDAALDFVLNYKGEHHV